ncbi:hypothetical protein K435DRAFT_862953 [Dendrothele bispora CBS 962.96]|uniref:Glucose receptor Git3 N-terminal domain-containing protein n=1 Tax=Dendrothele bispora (strain CBS 962.96) TaxID=1314807 RepID=A0A4V4HEQ1_DENBC|nr:hypothetical protein K435DRAFT_862953 [Dendrothele bispora CBS 962.96]
MALTEVSTTDSDDSHNKTIYEYSSSERAGVICISVAGLLSLTAILFLMIFRTPKPRTYQRTHLYGYVMSLFLACTLQSVGTVMNLKWVLRRQVEYGLFCAYQGAIKHFGNISIALWSFMISLHLFHLLFMRGTITHMTFWFQIILGWSVVNLFVIIGPLAIEKEDRGPYYGISGPWCWITSDYPKEQVYLEYFFEFFSAGLSLILYSIVILRVRGNIIQSDGNWCLRIVPRGQSWQLSFGRDLIDSAMLRVAQNMVWYPFAYTVLLIPITITRLTHFGGHDVPFGVTIFADVVFNLTGFVNAIMLLVTTKLFPDMSTIPDFRTKRNKHLTVYLGRHGGVTPFTLERSETAESWEQGRMAAVERQVSRSTDNDGTSTPEMTDVSSNGGRPRTPLLE